MRHRRYDTDDHPGRDPIVENPQALPTFRVTCVPKLGSPGRLVVYVRAKDVAVATEAVTNGRAPGIGLGWRVTSVHETDPEAAPNAPRVE